MARVEAQDGPFGCAAIRKRFWYPTARDRWRGALRTTWLARSRVEREAANLERIAAWGLQPPLLLAFGERRRLGLLHDSFLFTRALDARPLDERLRGERDDAARRRWLGALGELVGGLHARGFVDRDLHLRNVLATAEGTLAKIDSAFGAIVPRWRRGAARRRDLDDLLADLAAVTTESERAAFLRVYGAAAGSGG